MWSGLTSSRSEPTALAERLDPAPSIFIPKMFARKLSSDGMSRCPAPCLARNATRRPPSVPSTYGADGSPNGVLSVTSSRSVRSAMSYRPLPPMMPISTFISLRLRLVYSRPQTAGLSRHARPPDCGMRAAVVPAASNHALHRYPSVSFPEIPCGDDRVVFEEHEIFAGYRFAQKRALELQRLHWEQVVPHDPRQRHVGNGRDEIGHEHGGLRARFDQQQLMMLRMSARAAHANARRDFSVLLDERQHPGQAEGYVVVVEVARPVALMRMHGVVPLSCADDVLRSREPGPHDPVGPARREPPGMIEVQVRGDHHVDIGRTHPGVGQGMIEMPRAVEAV